MDPEQNDSPVAKVQCLSQLLGNCSGLCLHCGREPVGNLKKHPGVCVAIGHPGTLLTSYGCSSPACAAVAFQLFLLIPMCPQQCLLLVSVQKKTCKQKHMA